VYNGLDRVVSLSPSTDRIAVISAKNHKRQRRTRQSVTAKREKSQALKGLNRNTNLTYTNFGVCACGFWRYRMLPHGTTLRGVAVISAKNHKRQRRKRQSVTAKREK